MPFWVIYVFCGVGTGGRVVMWPGDHPEPHLPRHHVIYNLVQFTRFESDLKKKFREKVAANLHYTKYSGMAYI